MQRLAQSLKSPRFNSLPVSSTRGSFSIPLLAASGLACARQPSHIQAVQKHLQDKGILKITLQFPDDDSNYLRDLISGLNQFHGHGLPIDHSASRGWFWDIRPSSTSFQSNSCQARSETMEDFPWHTDCSYEDSPPRYFGLQVLKPDRRGGGTFSALSVQRVVENLSAAAKAALRRPEYSITVPPEFIRSGSRDSIVSSLLTSDEAGGRAMMRFREDIIKPLSPEAGAAMEEVRRLLLSSNVRGETLHLASESMPRGSILLLDNRRWLHARNEVKDPERHLRRVRWDAIRFGVASS